MKGKHFKKENSIFPKFFILIFLILLIIAILIMYKKFIYNKEIVNTTNGNISNENNEPKTINNINSEIDLHKTVENCDFLEITGLNITSQDEYYFIKTNIINNSNDLINNFVLNISIFDNNNNLITKLSNPVEGILPGESLQAFGVVREDLSKAHSYKVEKN